MSNRLVAQQSPSEKKTTVIPTGPTTGFKKKSPTTTPAEKKSPVQSPGTVSTSSERTVASQTQPALSPVEREKAAKASEAIRIDYKNMPADVQARIDRNKAQGKYLLDGIAKSFTVEIKTCLTDADHKKTLSFLKTKTGFIKSQFISTGVVKIIVEPVFDSENLKEAMVTEGIHFNFLNRSYLLKN